MFGSSCLKISSFSNLQKGIYIGGGLIGIIAIILALSNTFGTTGNIVSAVTGVTIIAVVFLLLSCHKEKKEHRVSLDGVNPYNITSLTRSSDGQPLS